MSDSMKETEMLMVLLYTVPKKLIHLGKPWNFQRIYPKSNLPHIRIHQTTRNLLWYPPTLLLLSLHTQACATLYHI